MLVEAAAGADLRIQRHNRIQLDNGSSVDGACTRHINLQHRFIYQVDPDERTVKVIRLWTHYE